MKKKVITSSSKLELIKEKIANLTPSETDQTKGGGGPILTIKDTSGGAGCTFTPTKK